MRLPTTEHRYAVVSPGHDGPNVSFWPNHTSVISLMTYYSNVAWSSPIGFSVWQRRNSRARWVCITN